MRSRRTVEEGKHEGGEGGRGKEKEKEEEGR